MKPCCDAAVVIVEHQRDESYARERKLYGLLAKAEAWLLADEQGERNFNANGGELMDGDVAAAHGARQEFRRALDDARFAKETPAPKSACAPAIGAVDLKANKL